MAKMPRQTEHWPRAEAEMEIATRRISANNTTAALAYDRNQTEFAREVDVAAKAKAAKRAVEGPEGEALRQAEAASQAPPGGATRRGLDRGGTKDRCAEARAYFFSLFL
jgi:hypothetical protein